jgi:hypothetical protein
MSLGEVSASIEYLVHHELHSELKVDLSYLHPLRCILSGEDEHGQQDEHQPNHWLFPIHPREQMTFSHGLLPSQSGRHSKAENPSDKLTIATPLQGWPVPSDAK